MSKRKILTAPFDCQLCWVAGFFEGEGNFGPNMKSGKYICPVVQIAQSYREPLDCVRDIMKVGKIYGPYGPYTTQKKPYFQYSAYGSDALHFIDMVLPYLFSKGDQVLKTLEEYNFGKQ